MIPARQSPNDPDMISIAAGNDAMIGKTHERSLSAGCDLAAAGAGDRVRERRFSVKSTNKNGAQGRAGSGRRRPPTALPSITQHAGERRCEPHQVQDVEREEGGANQNPGAIAVIERDELLCRRTHLRLTAVDDPPDDESHDEKDAATEPIALPIDHVLPPFSVGKFGVSGTCSQSRFRRSVAPVGDPGAPAGRPAEDPGPFLRSLVRLGPLNAAIAVGAGRPSRWPGSTDPRGRSRFCSSRTHGSPCVPRC